MTSMNSKTVFIEIIFHSGAHFLTDISHFRHPLKCIDREAALKIRQNEAIHDILALPESPRSQVSTQCRRQTRAHNFYYYIIILSIFISSNNTLLIQNFVTYIHTHSIARTLPVCSLQNGKQETTQFCDLTIRKFGWINKVNFFHLSFVILSTATATGSFLSRSHLHGTAIEAISGRVCILSPLYEYNMKLNFIASNNNTELWKMCSAFFSFVFHVTIKLL